MNYAISFLCNISFCVDLQVMVTVYMHNSPVQESACMCFFQTKEKKLLSVFCLFVEFSIQYYPICNMGTAVKFSVYLNSIKF